MVSKEEIRIFKIWQFFDKHRFFPFEKRRIDLTISGEAITILEKQENKSRFVESLILEN